MIRPDTAARGTACVAMLAALFGGACRSEPREQGERAGQRASDSRQPIAQRIGWLHGSCLVIENGSLMPGTPLTLVLLDDGQSIVEARVTGPTDAADRCHPLRADRRAGNAGEGVSFYEVTPIESRKIDLAIAVLGQPARIGTGLDVDGDGKVEQFTRCATSEGVSFRVWTGPPYQGTALWTGYYYLGYDTETTCPS